MKSVTNNLLKYKYLLGKNIFNDLYSQIIYSKISNEQVKLLRFHERTLTQTEKIINNYHHNKNIAG